MAGLGPHRVPAGHPGTDPECGQRYIEALRRGTPLNMKGDGGRTPSDLETLRDLENFQFCGQPKGRISKQLETPNLSLKIEPAFLNIFHVKNMEKSKKCNLLKSEGEKTFWRFPCTARRFLLLFLEPAKEGWVWTPLNIWMADGLDLPSLPP